MLQETPTDEMDVDDKNSKLIPVGHFFKDGSTIQQFGTPFFVTVKKVSNLEVSFERATG